MEKYVKYWMIVSTLPMIFIANLSPLCIVTFSPKGTYTYASGNVYVGEYENGKMHGKVRI